MSIIKQLNKPPVQADITEWTWKEWFQSVWRILKNFYSDGNTNYSGVGGDVPFIPQSTFHVLASDSSDDGVFVEMISATNHPKLEFRNPGLTAGAKASNAASNILGIIQWDAYKASPEAYTPAATIEGSVQTVPGSSGGYSGGQLELKVSDGTTAPDTKVLVNVDGNIGLLSGAIPGPANTFYDKVLFSGYHNILVGKSSKTITNAQMHFASNAEYAADAWSKIVAGPAVVSRQDAGAGQYDIWTFNSAATVDLGTTPRFKVNSAGDFGFNAVPGAANTTWQKIRYGVMNQYLYYNGNNVGAGHQWTHNAEYNSGAWNYLVNGAASLLVQDTGLYWYTSIVGTAGGAVSWNQVAAFNSTGLGLFGAPSYPLDVTSATGVARITGAWCGRLTDNAAYSGIGNTAYTFNSTNYCLIQGSDGYTLLNCTTTNSGAGQIHFRRNNVTVGSYDGTNGWWFNNVDTIRNITISQSGANGPSILFHTGTSALGWLRMAAAGTISTVNAGYSAAVIDISTATTNGWGIQPESDNAYTCGATGHRWSAIWSANGIIQTSDARNKTGIQNSTLGLDFINSLRPVSYKFVVGGNKVVDIPPKKDENGNDILSTDNHKLVPTPGKRTHWGLIAQEVKTAIDAAGVSDFAGWVKTDLNDPNSEEGLNYQQFMAPMIKAIQELSAKVKALEAKLP